MLQMHSAVVYPIWACHDRSNRNFTRNPCATLPATPCTAPGGFGQVGFGCQRLLPRLHKVALQLGAPPLQLLHLLLQRQRLPQPTVWINF